MNIEDLLKDNNPEIIDAEKLFDEQGEIKQDYFNFLLQEKPILPNFKDEERAKFLSIKENRNRYVQFPDRLPTRDYMPYPVDAHELIGEFETKHNLYLTIAVAYNKLIEKIEALQKEIDNLKQV